MKDTKEYDKLEEMLETDFKWPRIYMYKFIIPFLPESIKEAEALFSSDADIVLRESKNLKYMSITAKQMMKNPKEVIAIYRKAESIKGIMGL
ncbi:MAG: DUF493 family protein [Bacteroidales bacterium]|nr:DUF493 family protein [Bacteroidales bacterium]